MRCQECDERVKESIVSTEQHTKTKKSYGDRVETVGERVKVRKGFACDCTTWIRHSKMDETSFEVKPDRFPNHWIQNYYESEN